MGGTHSGGVFHLRKIPPLVITPPGVTAVASVALSQQRQHTAKPLMFCVWCSLALVLARPFGSGDSVTPGLSMHRVPAASENPDGSRRLNALSFEWPGRLNHGAEFSTPRPRGFSAPMVFSYLTMNVANLLKRRPPRAAHDQVHQAPHWYQVKHTGVHGGTSPPSSSAADLPPEEWVVRGGTTPRLLPDDDERSWGDLQGGDSRHPSA